MSEEVRFVEETGTEDIGSIRSVRDLMREYVYPIDSFRSLMKPSSIEQFSKVQTDNCGANMVLVSSVNDINNAEFNTSRPLESRASAFYRMLGLPVVSPKGSIYSPGFDPNAPSYNSPSVDRRNNIVKEIFEDQKIADLIKNRDQDVEDRRSIFANQDSNSSYYALAIRFFKSFNLLTSDDPFNADTQISPVINDRNIILQKYTGNKSRLQAPRHILKPFITNPKMESVVNPQERVICAPFLKSKEDTLLSVNNSIKRPGIEFIIRIRLAQNDTDKVFLDESTRLLTGKMPNNKLSLNETKNVLIALSGNLSAINKNKDILNSIKDFSKTETNTLVMLNKSIRSALEEMYKQIQQYDAIVKEVNFTPVPEADGPEFGGKVTTLGSDTTASSFEQRIAALKIKDLNAQRQERALSERIGGKDVYASTPMANLQVNFQSQISKIEKERDEIAETILNSLAIIEMVVGEVSGLGLVDVLVIYTALWSISKEALIGLLDDESYNRLINYNPEISEEAKQFRSASDSRALDSLKEFELKVSNVLSFADYYLNELRKSPISNQSGNFK